MFKTSHLSASSDEDSNNDEIPNFSTSNDHSFQVNDYSTSSKSDDDVGADSEDDNEGALELDLQPHGTNFVKQSAENDFADYGRSEKRSLPEDFDDFDRPAKRKSKYRFNDDISNLVTSKSVPLKEDNKGRSLLERMGYKSGKGLGKYEQGRVEPVELSKQRGRRGLGLSLPGLDPESLNWDSSLEVVNPKEKVTWLKGELEPLDLDTLREWKREGPKDMNIEKMVDFCDETLLSKILKGKDVFDSLTSDELNRGRSRCNPFETLRSGMFLNRAALKMANMDSCFGFMFTNPKTEDEKPMLGPNQLLYFADVCAGPGGFSEYVLWRKKWLAKGFGFTLKGDCDFRLCDFFAGSPETFEPFYGIKGDGNVFDPDNIRSFTDDVMKGTDGKGVHFMMADGGFSVEGQENYQEILSKQLYLCQFLVAMCIVRKEGHFLCKLFDIFSPFSAGLVYLMYRAFNEISIFKPNTSRPANSERYIVCKHKREDSTPIKDYMFELCERLWEFGSLTTNDITHCVPLSVMLNDEPFYEYLVDSNNSLGERQVINLMKIAAFCRDANLVEGRQAEMRKTCLSLWEVPDKPRLADRSTADEAAKRAGFIDEGFLSIKPKELRPDLLLKSFNSLYDWHCVPLGSVELNIYLGLGRNKIFRWVAKDRHWVRDTDCNFELSPGTIVYGEKIFELLGEGRSQKKRNALHVVDAVALGYENISKLHYKDRLQRMNLFAAALKKQEYHDKLPVRIKQPTPMEDLNDIFEGLTVRYSKNNMPQLILENKDYWFQPKGILFVHTTKAPWTRYVSKTYTNHHYYFHPYSRQSKYDNERPPDANSNVQDCISKQLIWIWEDGVGLQKEEPVSGVVHKDDLLKFISKKVNGTPA